MPTGRTVPELLELPLPVQATDETVVYRSGGNLKRADMSDVRTYMQSNLGTIATQNANAVAITGGTITGITDLAVADGGTGASNASAARTNLGVAIGTDVQAYNLNLASLSGLTLSADQLLYATGVNTLAQSPITSFGRSLVDDADASAARTTLGVAIGTNVQAYNLNLASLSGLTLAADKLVYSTAVNTLALADLTSFGRSLLDDVDASAARTTLGLTIGTNVQAYNARLQDISTNLTATSGTVEKTGADTFGTYTVTAAGKALLDDTDAAAQRTTLAAVGSVELAASTGSTLMGHIASGTGAATRTAQAVLRETIRVNDFTGVDPTGATDSYAGIVAAIAATPTGGTLELNGYYRCSTGITINRTMRIAGPGGRTSNVTDGANSKAFLYFDTNVADGIIVDGCTLTVSGVIVVGVGVGVSTGNGIRTVNVNSNIVLSDLTVVQNFFIGLNLASSFYNRVDNSSIVFCSRCITADGIYNLTVVNSKLRPEGAGSRAYTLLNGAQAVMVGGSMESFQEFGVLVLTGSGIRFFGTYMESDPNTTTAWNAYISDNCSYERYGCHVYMTCARDVSVEGSGTDNYRIISHNTYIVPEATSRRVDIYGFNATKAGATVDIRGDIFVPGATVGANNNYLNPDLAALGAPAAGRGQYYADYPVGTTNFGKGYNNTIDVADPAVAAFSTPKALTMMGWGAADAAGDPIGIRTAYGPNAPYRAVYSNSQWEKVGLRMANQADATGGATVDAEARTAINGLLAKLRSAGVMI
jgi:hypothetical protein